MCGIFAVFSSTRKPLKWKKCGGALERTLREVAYEQSSKQRHRGPDYTGIQVFKEKGIAMVHERLAVVGVYTGNQPLKSSDETILMVASGEIYNYIELSERIRKKRGSYKPKSDCSVIIELYEDYGKNLFEHITGMYAFVLYDSKEDRVLIARDPHGIIPLYIGRDNDNNIWVASEMKCFVSVCSKVDVFEPGTMLYGPVGKLKPIRFYNPPWYKTPQDNPADLVLLRESLETAVRCHLQCEVNFGAMLSGGVDSSLIASIATKIQRETNPNFRLRTFSVGLRGAPDFVFSRKVANHINSIHEEITFTTEQGLDCIRDLIYKLETYDVATVRCSIPMYILTRAIKSQGIKMAFSGEGSDEIFGGYLYFYQAPTLEDFHEELVTRVRELHLSDCLRANKSTMAWGVELRVPFLDKAFVDLIMSIDPDEKIPVSKNCTNVAKKSRNSRIEKYILRKAFEEGNYLPKDVLWRQKEQFSDGVGYSFIDTLLNYIDSHVSDEEFTEAANLYPDNTPKTKEAFYYRMIFNEFFPGETFARTVTKWTPRTDWGCSGDPSGRKQTAHEAYQ